MSNGQKQLEWKVPFKRVGDFPLDRSSSFKTLALAEEYLNATEDNNKVGLPYDGQIISVKNTGVYRIDINVDENNQTIKKLTKISDYVPGDDNSIEITEDNEISVKEVKTNIITLNKNIVVAGLDEKFGAGNYKNNDVITSGTDIYTILENILCKELYPEKVGKRSASASAGMDAPTITIDKTGTQEVGTKITLVTCKAGASNATNKKDSLISGMTYGYSSSNDNTRDSEDTEIKTSVNVTVNNNVQTISATLSGFNADTTTYPQNTPQSVTVTGNTPPLMVSTVLGCIVEGTNSITVNTTGCSYSVKCDAIEPVYYCSNLGKTNADKKTSKVEAVDTTTSNATSSGSTSVTGKYYYFMGYSDNTSFEQFTSDSVRALNTKTDWIVKDGTTTIVDATAIKSNGKSIVIACPSNYKLASVNNGVGADILENFTTKGSQGVVSVKTGEINTNYNVYIYPITNGAVVEFKNVTLTK